jgi:flagellar biosynthesis protein FliR
MLSALQHILANLGLHGEASQFVVLFGLIFARISIAVGLSPFLGGKTVSGKLKVGLAVGISAVLFENVAPNYPPSLSTVTFIWLLLKEVVIGATFGIFAQLIFHSVQMAGALVDYGRGMSQATLFAPQLETNTSLLGQLQFQAALIFFLLLNGHLLFLHALGQSFFRLPILTFPAFSGGIVAATDQVARYTAESLLIAVQLSAPALLALFLVDVSFGMLGRVASGLNVHNESQPVKAMVGLAIVLLALAYIFHGMPKHFEELIQQIGQLTEHLR